MKFEGLVTVLQIFLSPEELALWQEGDARPLMKFHKELQENEAKIGLLWDTLIRHIKTLSVYIYIDLGRYRWTLVETKQCMPEGTIKHRRHDSSLSEKNKFCPLPPEEPETLVETFIRALKQELEIDVTGDDLRTLIFYEVKIDGPRSSTSFPGEKFKVENELHMAMWPMPFTSAAGKRLFKRHYVEYTEDGREIHHGWKKTARLQKD